MPSRCVAAGCSNTSSESVSVYKFPKQETLLKQWTKQVQRTRAYWVPTASSTLCSEHFEADCCFNEPAYIRPHFNKLLCLIVAPLLYLHHVKPGYGGCFGSVVPLRAWNLFRLRKLGVN
uniref:THAP domain-containing protein 1 n=1 Tax=Oryzias latipes TaxID=8090 RepID=A0A3P9I3W1_ORYLA